MFPWKKRKDSDFSDDFQAIEKIIDELIKDFADQVGFSGEISSKGVHVPEKDGKPFSYGFSLKVFPGEKPEIIMHDNSRSRSRAGVREAQLGAGKIEPLTELIENNDEFAIVINVPGVRQEELNMKLIDNVFMLESSNKEFPYKKLISLSVPVRLNKSSISLNNGILEIRLKKGKLTKKAE